MTEAEDRYHFIEWLKDLRDIDGLEQSAFGLAVELRLIWGQKEYGDKSFAKPLGDLAYEVMQETYDIPAWIYILRQRLVELEPDTAKREQMLRKLDSVCRLAHQAWAILGELHPSLVDIDEKLDGG